MSYRIEKGESLGAAFGRIATEEMYGAMSELRGDCHNGAVHNVRKALKRLRALLRSLRVALPDKFYREENLRFAEAGRKISPLRDLQVQIQTLAELPADAASKSARQSLLRRQRRLGRQIPALRRAVRGMLQGSRLAAAAPIRRATVPKLAAGLKKIYKQGRARYKAAARRPTAENLHEWRKQVKALGFGFELIQSLGPKRFVKLMERCDQLSSCLGEDHDLLLTLEALRLENAAHPARDYRRLARRISERRQRLARRACKLGRKLYVGKAAEFGERLDRCLANF